MWFWTCTAPIASICFAGIWPIISTRRAAITAVPSSRNPTTLRNGGLHEVSSRTPESFYMSNVIPFDYYRAQTKLEVAVHEFRDFAHRYRSGDTAIVYHVERLEKAVEGLKKALFEFED